MLSHFCGTVPHQVHSRLINPLKYASFLLIQPEKLPPWNQITVSDLNCMW